MLRDLPLSGVVVVELSDSASAPFSGKILAALGAEVWKVERPTGDSARGWGPSQWKGSGAAFHALNRGKRCVSLDIKDPQQLATLHQLIAERADVFIHNLRPGSSSHYGLDADSLGMQTVNHPVAGNHNFTVLGDALLPQFRYNPAS